jgi:hypothetical protein
MLFPFDVLCELLSLKNVFVENYGQLSGIETFWIQMQMDEAYTMG